MTDTIAILDANAVISLGQISDRINTPSLMDAFYSPEWQASITTTVRREVDPERPENGVAVRWMSDGILRGTLREFNTDHIPRSRGAGEASIVAIIEANSGSEFIVVTDDARAGQMINRLDLEDVKVLNLQGYVESSLLTGGVNYADYMNIALQSGWAPLGMSAGIGGLQFGRTTITNGVTIEATPEGLIITDVDGRQHYVSPTETFRITKDGRFIAPRCFPAQTPIAISPTQTKPIADIRVGDTVLAFDPAADLGRGALVPRKVVRLYRNTTAEWIKLTWAEGGEAKELISTPGHHFLDQFGNFPTVEGMLENGRATVILASGETAEVTAARITYSADTAHLFEQAQAVGMIAGNTALKPAAIDAWQTYNFEVEDLHTYVAGGVRVHNDSGFLGYVGNVIDNRIDTAFNGRDGDGTVRDKITNVLTYPLHLAGEVVSAVTKAATSIIGGVVDTVSNLAQGDILGAAESLLGGIARVVGAVGQALHSILEAAFGPGGNSGNPETDPRFTWEDSDGSTHYGSAGDYDRAVKRGDVGGYDPIIIDLDGDGVELSPLGGSTARFDVDNDGFQELTAWVGKDDGLLVYDLGGDGAVSEAKEIAFAEWTAETTDTDLDALKTFAGHIASRNQNSCKEPHGHYHRA